MLLRLHNPANQAHIEELKDRLNSHLALVPVDPYNRMWTHSVTHALVEVVRGLDRGVISVEDAQAVFGQFRLPGFSFAKWLAEMVDEGIYLDVALDQAA
jgi:hypothetical protein